MRFALMIEAQMGLSYADQLAIVRRAEAAGFEAFFRSDHYQSFPGPDDAPTTDAWAVLAGLARDTSRIGLGALVSPVTFRWPGNLARVVATVDEMSGGRIEVGMGAGWNETEHRQYGVPFPPIEVRAEMLEEAVQVVRGLWEEPDGWSFIGKHYRVEGAVFHAKPERRLHLILGGGGSPRSMRLAARLADEFNLTSSRPEQAAEKYAYLDDACRAIGRDPETLVHSAMIGVLVASNGSELRRREEALMAALGAEEAADEWFAERRERWIIGTPEAARDAVRRFAAVGVERIMLQDFLPHDLEMIDVMGAELVGRV
jgi:F420-dependent oxidoreductase-like protein